LRRAPASAGAASTRCFSTARRARGSSSGRSTATCLYPSILLRKTDAGLASAASTCARRRPSAVPYQLDARRCISYLTIEHKSAIPEELRPLIGNRVYGCDDCQLVCPWNGFAQPSAEEDFKPRNGLDRATLVELFAWTEAEFDQRLQGSPIRRIGYERWLRNLAVGLGNAPTSAEVVGALHARANHPSTLVASMSSGAPSARKRHEGGGHPHLAA
jgi:hypothetical protein